MGVQVQDKVVINPDAAGLPMQSSSPLIKGIRKTRDRLFLFLNEFGQFRGKYTPSMGLAIIVLGIIIADVVAMVLVYDYLYLPYYLLIIIETAILSITILPLLYIFSLRPLLIQIDQRKQEEGILQARVRLMQSANTQSLDTLLETSLDEIERITGSTIGFFHFVAPDEKTIILQTWSTNTLRNMCRAEGKGSMYDVEKAGVWADAIRLRRPIIHNDYQNLAHRKGLPPGHAEVLREIVIPILRNNRVVGIMGLGNKPTKYTPHDINTLSTYADFAWDVVGHKLDDIAIQKSEEKFHTLVDWTYDWESWVDPDGKVVYVSPSCERITGYTPEEFIDDHKLMVKIIHPADQPSMYEHQKLIHESTEDAACIEFRILTKDGSEKWIEHICRPLFDAEAKHLGRRISNRDITERKNAEEMIRKQNQREQDLTKTIHNLQNDIGRDLHDTLGNQISFLRMSLEHLSETQWTDPSNVRNQLQRLTKAANDSYEMVRAMLAVSQTENLEDPLSLFTRFAEQFTDRSSVQCEVISRGESRQLNLHQIRQLFYIYREALGNIEKYARAKKVSSQFIWNGQDMKLVITDNGVGFDLACLPTTGHYGLKFMRERAKLMKGSFHIESSPGEGTTITVVVPYDPEAEIQLV